MIFSSVNYSPPHVYLISIIILAKFVEKTGKWCKPLTLRKWKTTDVAKKECELDTQCGSFFHYCTGADFYSCPSGASEEVQREPCSKAKPSILYIKS